MKQSEGKGRRLSAKQGTEETGRKTEKHRERRSGARRVRRAFGGGVEAGRSAIARGPGQIVALG